MNIKIGLCGLPNSGKSTFLKLVSQVDVLIAPYLFSTLSPQEVIAPIITPEIKNLHLVTKTEKLLPPYLIFVDIPGLIRGAHRGEGLGNEFLSYLRGCDVILEVVRNFLREDVSHPEGNIDPQRDILIIEEEIIEAEKIVCQRAIKRLEKTKDERFAFLKEIFSNLKPFNRFPEFSSQLKEFNLLLTKDWFLLINGREFSFNNPAFKNIYNLDLEWELEILRNQEVQKEFPSKVYEFLNQLRKDLELIQFFTFTSQITQGWLIKKGSKIIEVAEMIHSDFALKFKKAETISLENFVKIKDWNKARSEGLLKIKGREAEVEENEIIFVKI